MINLYMALQGNAGGERGCHNLAYIHSTVDLSDGFPERGRHAGQAYMENQKLRRASR